MTKVLVVDDSALMRRLMNTVLSEAGFQVQTARNGAEGVNKLVEFEPDVVTLDVNMPEMDGLTALSLMMERRPTPVVMVSSLTTQGAQATFEALALGAVDYVAKPGGTISLSMDEVAEQLISKVKTAARARLRKVRQAGTPQPSSLNTASRGTRSAGPVVAEADAKPDRRAAVQPTKAMNAKPGQVPGLVVIGVSTGGPRTLEDILPRLPARYPWPVLVAQHMPPNFTSAFAERMDRACALRVREVADSLPIEPGHVYLGRGGTDMTVTERMGRLVVQSRPESAEHLWHPSVELLVESAMRHMPAKRLVGVMLTGMGYDGARAMAALREAGGRTIAESEETAVVFGMPRELIELQGASVVLPCDEISDQLLSWIH